MWQDDNGFILPIKVSNISSMNSVQLKYNKLNDVNPHSGIKGHYRHDFEENQTLSMRAQPPARAQPCKL